MGGRGGSSGVAAKSANPPKSNKSNTDLSFFDKQKSELSKMPKYGTKVQNSFIGYVKHMTNIDLEKSRDTYFDDRKGFNVDTKKISRNTLNTVKQVVEKYDSGYDVKFTDNGPNRIKILVANRFRK